MQYSTLIAQIEADIYSNGAELITGDILQTVLKRMVSAWASAGAAYGGTISPDTVVPLNLDQATVYLALTAGTYEHFLDGEGDPIETTGPALVIYDGGPALIFSKTDLPSGGSGATVITGGPGDSLVVTLPKGDEGIKASYRIDMTAQYTGGSEVRYIGSLIIEANELAMQVAHGYYYGDDMAEILSEVAIWKDDPEIYPDEQGFYLLLTMQSDLDEVIFSVSSLDGQTVDADIANEDEKVKVADATISPVGGSSDVFWATYGSTTYADAFNAWNSGKLIALYYSNKFYIGWYHLTSGELCFSNFTGATQSILTLKSSGWASGGAMSLENSYNKVSTLSGNETSTTKYLNCKGMADALGKIGVISQTQTWTQASDGGYDYTMSDPVRGLIPQANIDLFESAGAVFNEQTGYFELNGLTDLSYEDMVAIYGVKNALRSPSRSCLSVPARTVPNFPVNTYNNINTDFEYAFKSSNVEILFTNTSNSVSNSVNLQKVTQLFYDCKYLKKCGYLRAVSAGASGFTSQYIFYNCFSLEDIYIRELKGSIRLDYSPRLTTASILFMIEQETAGAAFTITLHATAYARATADADITAALAVHTNVTLASA